MHTCCADAGIGQPFAIAAGPDGALWFGNTGTHSIGRMTTSGVVSNYTDASIGFFVFGIAAGPDGALWFTNSFNPDRGGGRAVETIGRISTSGVVSNYHGPSEPDGIAAGPDGALWFTNTGNDSIGRIQATPRP